MLALAGEHLRETKRKYLGTFAYDGNSQLTDIFGSPERWQFDAILAYLQENNLIGDSVAVDAGANLGMLSLRFSKLYSKVFSFEPHPLTFEMLQRNLRLYAPNAEAIQRGLSSNAGKFKLGVDTDNIGNFYITNESSANRESYDVETVRLDDFFRSRTFRIGLIKIDIEGHEFELFKGATETISKDKPVILVEDGNSKSGSKSESIKLLESLGYKTFLEPALLPVRSRTPRNAVLRRGILALKCLFQDRGYGLIDCDFEDPGGYAVIVCIAG